MRNTILNFERQPVNQLIFTRKLPRYFSRLLTDSSYLIPAVCSHVSQYRISILNSWHFTPSIWRVCRDESELVGTLHIMNKSSFKVLKYYFNTFGVFVLSAWLPNVVGVVRPRMIVMENEKHWKCRKISRCDRALKNSLPSSSLLAQSLSKSPTCLTWNFFSLVGIMFDLCEVRARWSGD